VVFVSFFGSVFYQRSFDWGRLKLFNAGGRKQKIKKKSLISGVFPLLKNAGL